MHGDNDHRIGLRQSERLRDGLAAAGVPASPVVVPGAVHGGH
jgi:dipeptidyl aminopeptidase/acylaminoacyl peptidase